jgi:hypothetical protein
MGHVRADAVQEVANFSGTVAVALGGARTKMRAFGSVMAAGDTCYVRIEHDTLAQYENCLVTFTPGSLARGAIQASSNGNARVDFSTGPKTVTLVAPASVDVAMDPNGDARVTRNLALGADGTLYATAGALNLQGQTALVFQVAGGAERGRFNTIGLGIGTTAPVQALHIAGVTPAIAMENKSAAADEKIWDFIDGASTFELRAINDVYSAGNTAYRVARAGITIGYHAWCCGGSTERMRLSGANLGIGTPAPVSLLHVAGDITIESAAAKVYFARNGAVPDTNWSMGLVNNPAGTNYVYQSALTITAFGGGANYGFLLRNHAGTPLLEVQGNNGHVTPGADNTQNLGSGARRFATLFAGTGVINTSGRDEKLFITPPSDAERRAAAQLAKMVRRYKYKDAVAAKGEDEARWHFGFIAEDVRDALAAEGLDPFAYGMLGADPLLKPETYTETATRPKTRTVTSEQLAVEMRDGRAVQVRKTVESIEPVGAWVDVFDEDGEPLFTEAPADDSEQPPRRVPLRHFVEELEEYQVERTRQVETGEVRYGLRYDELFAFLRAADAPV